MKMFIIILRIQDKLAIGLFRWRHIALMIVIATSLVTHLPTPSRAAEPFRLLIMVQTGYEWGHSRRPIPFFWGHNGIWRLGSKPWDRYGGTLGQDQAPGLENCGLPYELGRILPGNPRCDRLPNSFYIGWRHLFSGDSETPDETIKDRESPLPRNDHFTTISVRQDFQVYLIQRKDSLWKIARQFGMQPRTLAELNNLRTGEILQIGRPLKVKVSTPRELTLTVTSRSITKDPSFFDQIRLTDGHPVPRWMLKGFVVEVVDRPSPATGNVISGGTPNKPTFVVNFQLEEDHLEAQAKQFRPIVFTHAERYNIDPALITAMIHTESSFNPYARSRSSAYGLMQLVPHTAGKEAYTTIYGQDRKLSPEYLYDPANNIELGAAYLNILRDKYMKSITDPVSRIYCTVAAYHAGPSNVGRAFTPKQSIKLATPIINQLTPTDVYNRLVQSLPALESRNYVRTVVARLKKYREWYAKDRDEQT